MKKIGFVDFYISEWHANNYPGWIKETGEKLGLDYEVAYGWAEQDVSPVDGLSTAQWCDKMGVTMCRTVEELCEKSDCIIVLAPSNPETHLSLAQSVLPYGKRTYIDKTFAPDLHTAKKIFALAKEHSVSFFSSSALRYAAELKEFKNADNIIITGGGSNFNEYSIHMVEMAVVLLGDSVKRVKVEAQGEKQRLCRVITQTGKQATLVFAPRYGYSVLGVLPDGSEIHKNIQSDFFQGLIADILRFFDDGKLPFDSKQTLDVMAMRDALLLGEKNDGEWIDL